MGKKYVSAWQREGFGQRASLNHYVPGPRHSSYGSDPKASNFNPHDPWKTGYGSGRHGDPSNCNQLCKSDTPGPLPDAKASIATGHPKSAPKGHDAHLKYSMECCWSPGWRNIVTAPAPKLRLKRA